MPSPLILPSAKRKPMSRSISIWPLLSVSLFALNPLSSALAEAKKSEDSILTLGTVTVQGNTAGSGPLSTSRVLSSVDILGADILENMPVNYSWGTVQSGSRGDAHRIQSRHHFRQNLLSRL